MGMCDSFNDAVEYCDTKKLYNMMLEILFYMHSSLVIMRSYKTRVYIKQDMHKYIKITLWIYKSHLIHNQSLITRSEHEDVQILMLFCKFMTFYKKRNILTFPRIEIRCYASDQCPHAHAVFSRVIQAIFISNCDRYFNVTVKCCHPKVPPATWIQFVPCM